MTDYAAAAAAQLRKITDNIDKKVSDAQPGHQMLSHDERKERHKVVQAYSILAAIEKGILPPEWAERVAGGDPDPRSQS